MKQETQFTEKNRVNNIITYESEGLTVNDTIEFFAELIKSGIVWSLQGSYGRTAQAIIDAGYLSTEGKILKFEDGLE